MKMITQCVSIIREPKENSCDVCESQGRLSFGVEFKVTRNSFIIIFFLLSESTSTPTSTDNKQQTPLNQNENEWTDDIITIIIIIGVCSHLVIIHKRIFYEVVGCRRRIWWFFFHCFLRFSGDFFSIHCHRLIVSANEPMTSLRLEPHRAKRVSWMARKSL